MPVMVVFMWHHHMYVLLWHDQHQRVVWLKHVDLGTSICCMQVKRDREKITGVIGELDEKKRTALKVRLFFASAVPANASAVPTKKN